MRLARPLLVAWCIGSIAAGCTSDLTRSLDGKLCNSDDRCATGYICQLDTRRCLSLEQWTDPGLGGSPSDAASAGADSGSAGWGGNGGVGGDSIVAGNGGGGAGGVGGTDPDDAGPDPLDGGDGCVPTMLFRDRDDDTFGDVSDSTMGCIEPGWATRAGDCRDDIPIVRPNQTRFFGVGYMDPTKPGGVSFDYDCSGGEDADPTNNPSEEATECASILGVGCTGSGYFPVEARSDTGISGINPLCSSRSVRTCTATTLDCLKTDETLTSELAFRCR